MVAVITSDTIQAPAHPEGGRWEFVWAAGERSIFSDSASDIVAEIIPGYADLADTDDDDPHLIARVDTLAALAGRAQATVLADSASPDDFSEEELTAMLTDKRLPVDIVEWNPFVPLVLLTTSFVPFTEHRQPAGAVLWLDPATEMTFLSGLRMLGYGELWAAGAAE